MWRWILLWPEETEVPVESSFKKSCCVESISSRTAQNLSLKQIFMMLVRDWSPMLVRGCQYILKYATKFLFSYHFISHKQTSKLVYITVDWAPNPLLYCLGREWGVLARLNESGMRLRYKLHAKVHSTEEENTIKTFQHRDAFKI